jgi:hypothetical protein
MLDPYDWWRMSTTKTATAQASQPASGTSKLKKIEWYAGQLITEAVAKEKSGSSEEAILSYLKASDILLLLAKGQENYSVWKTYADRATQCQQRAKLLMNSRKTD